MTDKDAREKKVAVGAGTMLATAALAVDPTAGAIVTVATPAVTAGVAAAFSGALHQMGQRRIERFLADIAASQEFGTPESVLETIHKCQEEPWAQAALLETGQRLRDTLSDEAVPVIAAIAAELLATKSAPDWIHRAAGEAAASMAPGMVQEAGELVGALMGVPHQAARLGFKVALDHQPQLRITSESFDVLLRSLSLRADTSMGRVARMFQRFDLAEPATVESRERNVQQVWIQVAVVARLAKYFLHRRA